jgi:hypothetical protein
MNVCVKTVATKMLLRKFGPYGIIFINASNFPVIVEDNLLILKQRTKTNVLNKPNPMNDHVIRCMLCPKISPSSF